MKLEEKLLALRKEKGLSQLMLAEIMNVSRQAVSRWELGISIPSTENLMSLSKLYGVPIDYLMHEESERPVQSEKAKELRKCRSWATWVIGILIVVIVAAIIGVISEKREPKNVDFNEVESEDWGNMSTDDIPIEWCEPTERG